MAGLVYYAPGLRTMNRQKMVELGLAHVLADGGPTYCGMNPGPDGGEGVAFAVGPVDQEDPGLEICNRANWQELPGSEVWVGFDPEALPKPEELARDRQIQGHQVRLADGQQWNVPVARSISGESYLPQRLRWNGENWFPGGVTEKYEQLFEQACRLWDVLVNASEETVTLTDECGVVAMALAVNYRVGPGEISVLGLLDTQSEVRAVKALVDWPALEVLKKKLALEGQS